MLQQRRRCNRSNPFASQSPNPLLGSPRDELIGECESLFRFSDVGFDVILNLVGRLHIHEERDESRRIDLKRKMPRLTARRFK